VGVVGGRAGSARLKKVLYRLQLRCARGKARRGRKERKKATPIRRGPFFTLRLGA